MHMHALKPTCLLTHSTTTRPPTHSLAPPPQPPHTHTPAPAAPARCMRTRPRSGPRTSCRRFLAWGGVRRSMGGAATPGACTPPPSGEGPLARPCLYPGGLAPWPPPFPPPGAHVPRGAPEPVYEPARAVHDEDNLHTRQQKGVCVCVCCVLCVCGGEGAAAFGVGPCRPRGAGRCPGAPPPESRRQPIRGRQGRARCPAAPGHPGPYAPRPAVQSI